MKAFNHGIHRFGTQIREAVTGGILRFYHGRVRLTYDEWQAERHPQYQHDCERCTFLGRFQNHDLYHCIDPHTLIARFGEDGEYTSGLCFVAHIAVIREAGHRAVTAGLIDRNHSIGNSTLWEQLCVPLP